MSYAERAVMHISRPVYDKLTKLKNEQQDQLKRQVTYSEVIEELLNFKQAFTRRGEILKQVRH